MVKEKLKKGSIKKKGGLFWLLFGVGTRGKDQNEALEMNFFKNINLMEK